MTCDANRCKALGSAAVRYVRELGWPIRPQEGIRFDGHCTCWQREACRDPGKHPARKNWKTMASTDSALVRSWWLIIPYNIATHLHGVVAVDVDDDAALEALQPFGPWPVTPTQRTGRGWHFFFRVPPGGLPTLKDIDRLPIETKGETASLTLAPSKHVRGPLYYWLEGRDPFSCALADIPPRFLAHVRQIDAIRKRRKAARRVAVDVGDSNALAAIIQRRSATVSTCSNGLGRGAYGLRRTLEDNGADAVTIAAVERAWWRHHGHGTDT